MTEIIDVPRSQLNGGRTEKRLVSLEVATKEELLEFANKVREAGGGNMIPALLPAVPQESQACLIALNLNFDCMIDALGADSLSNQPWQWTMQLCPFDDEDYDDACNLAEKIGKALNLEVDRSEILLPEHIGNAAEAFDTGVAFQDLVQPVEVS